MKKKRVLIADDHPVIRAGLAQIIKESHDIAVTGEASNCTEVFEKTRQDDYDLVVLDISMPDGSGLDVLKQLKTSHPGLPVLILSIHFESRYAIRALRAGAAGYLNKRSAESELLQAVKTVLSGKRYISAELADILATEIDRNFDKPVHRDLSDREYEVLCLLALGRSIADISEHLSLSTKTISTYRARGLEKMGMKTNGEFTRYAIEHGLID